MMPRSLSRSLSLMSNDSSVGAEKHNFMQTMPQPRTQALSTTRLLEENPGPGWSRVSQILGDNNWDLWG
jgi:hypothetical protein